MSSAGNPRRVRVASAIRELLAEMIAREVKDPRVREAGFININHVEMNSDMSVARVYVSFLAHGGEPGAVRESERTARIQRRAMAGLEASANFLRGPLGRRLRLRHAPSLRFVADDSPSFQNKLREVVRADEHARAEAGPHPEPPDDTQGGDES
jgi:ribosome-binding factor A